MSQRDKAELAEKRQDLFTLLQEEAHVFGLPEDPAAPAPQPQARTRDRGDLPEDIAAMLRIMATSNDSMSQLLKLR